MANGKDGLPEWRDAVEALLRIHMLERDDVHLVVVYM